MDLVQTECDVPSGRVAWFANRTARARLGGRIWLTDSADQQDFHS
jgi:hypothetical protein